MPDYYIAADGGGSKLQAILYDDQLRILKTDCVAGVNTLFKPVDVVRRNIESMITRLLESDEGMKPIRKIKAADLCMVGAGDVMRQALCSLCDVESLQFHSEPVVGLGGALKQSGAVALSGTGSDAFFVKNRETVAAVGGWGPLLGDEGSGYDIGLRTIKAAIYTKDGRGEPSLLYDLVMKQWELKNLWEIVSHLAHNLDARHEIASAARLCADAAYAGDRIALRIYEHAALEMSYQTRTVIGERLNDWDGTVIVMGGAWKGHPVMYEIFKKEIELVYPEAKVSRPLYDPVVGCVVQRCIERGVPLKAYERALEESFIDYRYF